MRRNGTVRLYWFAIFGFTAFALAITASPVHAQFIPRSVGGETIGEKYHIESSGGFWSPKTEMAISSESLGISGDTIDFKQDLGLSDHRFREVRLVLRPTKKHKLRYQYIPILFAQTSFVHRDIKFNGQLYPVNLEVRSLIDWRAHRFVYEYDFVSLNRGFGGLILDAKYTDVLASLEAPGYRRESLHARAPIPAVGGIFRVYVVPNISITGEVTGFNLPRNNLIEDSTGHYLDVDFYGTFNFTKYVGAQIGYRSLDLGYQVQKDIGDFQLKGFYFGAVLRY